MAESRTASILALMLRRLALDHEELLGDKRAAVMLGKHVLQLGQAKLVWKIIIGEMHTFLDVPLSSCLLVCSGPDTCRHMYIIDLQLCSCSLFG